MQTLIHRFSLAGIALIAFSCSKPDAKLALAASSAFPVNALTADSSNVTLSASNDADTVLTFQWPAVHYGQQVSVTYTVELDEASDTSGPTAWGKAKTFVAGNNILTFSFLGKDLNNLASGMGLNPGASNSIVVRVLSQVDQYNGSASTVPPVYTNTVAVNLVPYGLDLYVPGGYQGWNPGSAPVLAPVIGRAGLYEGYVNITGSGIQYFKYTNAPDWNHTNYGDGGNGTFSTNGLAAGLSVPNSAYYELTANLNNNTWTATATTWGIIGDATPGGWGSDTQLTYDPVNQVWTATVPMIAAGSFKFRANNAWVIDFGIDAQGNLKYADNPFFGYTPGLNNLTVPVNGTYTIILDLHVSGKYTYQLIKN